MDNNLYKIDGESWKKKQCLKIVHMEKLIHFNEIMLFSILYHRSDLHCFNLSLIEFLKVSQILL